MQPQPLSPAEYFKFRVAFFDKEVERLRIAGEFDNYETTRGTPNTHFKPRDEHENITVVGDLLRRRSGKPGFGQIRYPGDRAYYGALGNDTRRGIKVKARPEDILITRPSDAGAIKAYFSPESFHKFLLQYAVQNDDLLFRQAYKSSLR